MIPYGRQSLDEDDIAAVVEALRGDFLTTGPKVAEFEAALCEATGAAHAVACSNGTAALHLAALALGLKPGQAVIVPSLTFLATANAVRYTGADVVFADVDPQTGLMGPEHLEEALSRAKGADVRAVFPVHLTGQCVDLQGIRAVADAYNLKIVADGCHALGGDYGGHPVGACRFEDMSVFSFHPVKTVTTGEGGAITTNDRQTAEFVRRLRSHGMAPVPEHGPWAYEMVEIGYNYRITDFQCALGLSQLNKLGGFVERRAALAALYDVELSHLAPVVQPPVQAGSGRSGWHLYAVRIDFEALGMSRADFMEALKEKGVGSQVHYIPVHTQPYYKNLYGALELKGAQDYYEHTLSLPLYPAMANEDVEFVAKAVMDIVKGR